MPAPTMYSLERTRGQHMTARAWHCANPTRSQSSLCRHATGLQPSDVTAAGVQQQLCLQWSCWHNRAPLSKASTVAAAAGQQQQQPASHDAALVPVTLISGISSKYNSAFAQALIQHDTCQLVVIEQGPTESPLLTAANYDTKVQHEIAQAATLASLVTVVDASRFLEDVLSCQSLSEAGMLEDQTLCGAAGEYAEHSDDEDEELPADDDRTVADVLIDQVEHANVLVLCSMSSLHAHQAAQLQELLRQLNPNAKLLPWKEGEAADPQLLGHTQQLDLQALQQSTGWATMLTAWEQHPEGFTVTADNGVSKVVHPTRTPQDARSSASSSTGVANDARNARGAQVGSHGVSTWLYIALRPFHPDRLMSVALSKTWQGVVRSCGYCWLATRNDIMGLWRSAGGAWQSEPSGFWAASLPAEERPADLDTSGWQPVWGDRCQQLVFTGIDMQEEQLRSMLDECLLTNEEMASGPSAWAELDDPLPAWEFEDRDHHDHDHGHHEHDHGQHDHDCIDAHDNDSQHDVEHSKEQSR